jgi:hypothetical protein
MMTRTDKLVFSALTIVGILPWVMWFYMANTM